MVYPYAGYYEQCFYPQRPIRDIFILRHLTWKFSRHHAPEKVTFNDNIVAVDMARQDFDGNGWGWLTHVGFNEKYFGGYRIETTAMVSDYYFQ